MHLEQHVDDLASTLEAGRRRLGSLDLGTVVESARDSVQAAAPEQWRRPKRRSRWPIVAAVLVVGAIGAMILFLRPTLQRAIDEHTGGAPDAAPGPTTEPPYEAAQTTSWGRTSEEKSDGDETGF